MRKSDSEIDDTLWAINVKLVLGAPRRLLGEYLGEGEWSRERSRRTMRLAAAIPGLLRMSIRFDDMDYASGLTFVLDPADIENRLAMSECALLLKRLGYWTIHRPDVRNGTAWRWYSLERCDVTVQASPLHADWIERVVITNASTAVQQCD